MARPRAFDENKVLSAAMHCFRASGYRNASIKDLEKATGLTSGSLYNLYRDKSGLFRAALDHYLATVIAPRMASHADADLDALEQLYLSLFEMPYSDGYGCLVINAAVEFGGGPSPIADDIAAALDTVEAGIHGVLSRHLPAEKVEPATKRLLLLYQGLLVSSRAGRADASVAAAIAAEFQALRAIAGSTPSKGEK